MKEKEIFEMSVYRLTHLITIECEINVQMIKKGIMVNNNACIYNDFEMGVIKMQLFSMLSRR